jgi:MYXO-CTERM domain-containing protein
MKYRPAAAAHRAPPALRLRLFVLAGAAGCLALLSSSAPAWAAPKFARLSYTGDTTTTMTVAWNTDAAAETEVRYGTAPGNHAKTVKGSSLKAAGALGFVHEATLTGLEPGAKYYYVAGSEADGFTAEQSFQTGPLQHENCGAFKFAFLGDNRPDPTFGGGENWPQILGQALAHQPAFALNGGDLVIEGDQIDQWIDFLKWTSPAASKVPFMPAIGNHDTGPGTGDGANYNQIFALPRSAGAHGSGTEDYYYFTYGNAIFVALSTEGYTTGTVKFGEQAAWLDEVLTANPRKWKFVFYHKPTYTHEALFDISHAPNEAGQNAAYVAVFDKHHVDMVFTSHNHWYERFEPSACANKGKAGSDQPCPVGATNFAQGTVYFVSGGAGAFTIPAFLCGSHTGRAKCSGKHHYILLNIDNEVLKLETWAAYPEKNEVMDAITITKPADTCTGVFDAGPEVGADASPAEGGMAGAAGAAGSGGAAGAAGGAGAGPDASAAGAGGSAQDAAVVPGAGGGEPAAAEAASSGGCGCRTGSAPSGAAAGGLALALLGALRKRRRGSMPRVTR